MSPKINLDVERLRNLYEKGIPVLHMAREFGTTRATVVRNMRDAGLRVRGISEAQFIQHSRLSTEQRKAMAHSANAAARGRKRPADETERVMRSRNEGRPRSWFEHQVGDALRARGFIVVHNRVFRSGDVVFAVNITLKGVRLAIEVDGGGWVESPRKRPFAQRKAKALHEMGWPLLRIQVDERRGRCVDMAVQSVLDTIDASAREILRIHN